MPMTAPKDWNQNGMGEPAQELVAAVVMDDRLGDDRAQPRHALAEPGRHPAMVQRKIGAARASSHGISIGTEGERATIIPWRLVARVRSTTGGQSHGQVKRRASSGSAWAAGPTSPGAARSIPTA